MKHLYAVILAGGSGERLWPLSRKQQPKQLIPFLNGKSLLEQTIDRVLPLVENKLHIVVVTNQAQEPLIKSLVGDQVGMIIAEPTARNTGPAILLACHKIMQEDNEALVLVLPSDAFIPDLKAFAQAIKPALEYAVQSKNIAVFGLTPTAPATGYGYIQADTQKMIEGGGFSVAKFHEKPDRVRAEKYMQQGNMYWNIGIFAARVHVFIEEFKTCAPEIADAVQRYMVNAGFYEDAPSISIDYAVMEKSFHVVVFPVNFVWNDVGNLRVFLELQGLHTSGQPGSVEVLSLDGMNNLAKTNKKIVACIGVSDLCIVETEDVLLIVKKDRAEDVKKILAQVKVSHQSCL